MQKIIFLLMIVTIQQSCFADTDTLWLDQQWKKCASTAAKYYSITNKAGVAWQQQMYYAENKNIYMTGNFEEPDCSTKTGNFNWFSKKGFMTDSAVYKKGICLYNCIFYEDHQKKTVLMHDSAGRATYVNSWDEFGNESYQDTFYQDSKGRDCHRDTAGLMGIINKENDVWRLSFSRISSKSLISTAYFKERLCKTRVRYGCWYYERQMKDSILFNEDGKKYAAWYFHGNGNKNAYHTFDNKGKRTSAKNRDENGNEIAADTLFLPALPEEGFNKWQKNIIKKINNDKTLDKKYRRNLYGSVYINFSVDDGGNVTASIKEHSLYKDMDAIILNACKEYRVWKPASQRGRKVKFMGTHSFSFVAGDVIKYRSMY